MGIKKSYNCTDCHIYFTITVEPDKGEETIKRQFPESAKAIAKGIEECPFCYGDLEEAD